MGLIESEKLKDSLREEEYSYYTDLDRVDMCIDEQPVVEAIPISWLLDAKKDIEELVRLYEKGSEDWDIAVTSVGVINALLVEWEKERESWRGS